MFGLDTLVPEVLAQGVVESGKAALKALMSKAGEKVGERAPKYVEDILIAKYGLDSHDERVMQKARLRMDPADRTRLAKKLVKLKVDGNPKLTVERYNWFRKTLPLDDIDEMVLALTGIAQLSDEDWARECIDMDYEFVQAEKKALKFFADLKTKMAEKRTHISTQVSAHPFRQDLKERRQRAKYRADNQSW